MAAAAVQSAAPASGPAGGQTMAELVGRTVADVERDLILETLTHCLGNRTHAATILGISIRTLRNKLKLYQETGIPVPPSGDNSSLLY
jgi:two-component system, response regulator FlrC